MNISYRRILGTAALCKVPAHVWLGSRVESAGLFDSTIRTAPLASSARAAYNAMWSDEITVSPRFDFVENVHDVSRADCSLR